MTLYNLLEAHFTVSILHTSNLVYLPMLHSSNLALFQSYILPILHTSNLRLSTLHSSNLTLFQSYTLPYYPFSILHSPPPYTLATLHSFILSLQHSNITTRQHYNTATLKIQKRSLINNVDTKDSIGSSSNSNFILLHSWGQVSLLGHPRCTMLVLETRRLEGRCTMGGHCWSKQEH